MHRKYDLSAKKCPHEARGQNYIMLHSCDVENCEDTSATMVEKAEKSKRKDERIAWPERQMMLATRIIHIYRLFLYTTF